MFRRVSWCSPGFPGVLSPGLGGGLGGVAGAAEGLEVPRVEFGAAAGEGDDVVGLAGGGAAVAAAGLAGELGAAGGGPCGAAADRVGCAAGADGDLGASRLCARRRQHPAGSAFRRAAGHRCQKRLRRFWRFSSAASAAIHALARAIISSGHWVATSRGEQLNRSARARSVSSGCHSPAARAAARWPVSAASVLGLWPRSGLRSRRRWCRGGAPARGATGRRPGWPGGGCRRSRGRATR